MSAVKMLILENRLGQKVRTFAVDSDAFNLVYLKDSRRIEGFSSLETLHENNIDYSLIRQIQISEVTEEGLELQGLGHLRPQSSTAIQSPIYALPPEKDEEQLKNILHKTAAGHIVVVILMIAVGWAWTSFFNKPKESPLVTIVVPEELQPKTEIQKARPHVQASLKKIKPSNKVYRPVAQKKFVVTRKYPVKTAKAKDVQRVGALAALGGTPRGTRGYEGLDNNSLKNIRSAGVGQGGGGIGNAGRGGVKGFMTGSGLIAGSAGEGGRAQSAGGYGTRGIGGGRAGYGKISLVGGTNAVSLPMDDEATVEGGLDRDQIIAVINRNKGQIIYCYEKGLQAQPSIGGRVAVDFVIGPSGRITTARVAQTSLRSKLVEDCMLARMKTWQFPRPVGNVNVDVLYPFELMRVSAR